LDNPICPPRDALAFVQLLGVINRGDYDVVHANSTKAGILGLAAARVCRVPAIVFTAQGLRGVVLPQRATRLFWRYGEPAYFRSAHRVVTVSEYGRREGIRRGILDPRRAVTIHNGIDIGRVDAGRKAERRRAEFGLGEGALIVGVVGRLVPQKGMKWWIEAAAHVARQNPRARFLIVGDGPERPALLHFARELSVSDRIIWAGEQEGVEILPLFDVFVQSSDYEGFSLAILEAMAARLPVVATDVGGNSEAIIEGETGYLAPARESKALGEAILKVLSDTPRRRAMGERGRQVVEEHFSEQVMVREYERLYLHLLQHKGRSLQTAKARGGS
jgi:glycosyltransferase involved in cell wall biosynthesis